MGQLKNLLVEAKELFNYEFYPRVCNNPSFCLKKMVHIPWKLTDQVYKFSNINKAILYCCDNIAQLVDFWTP